MDHDARDHDRATCLMCLHATEHGWYGDTVPRGGTHCRDCGATWTGTAAAHTVCCHITFGGNSTADKYHDGFVAKHGQCPIEAGLAEGGMILTGDHRGRVWRSPYAGPEPLRAGRDGQPAPQRSGPTEDAAGPDRAFGSGEMQSWNSIVGSE